MELVFFYVVKSDSGFIENTGFNFSPNYKFSVEHNLEDDVFILKQEECITKLPHDFFDEDGCITNVTAIVGENGSGKTTLLNALRDYSLADENNIIHLFDRKFISIYLKSNKLFCYHNLLGLQIDVSVKLLELNPLDDERLDFISRIYVTNSKYSASPLLNNWPSKNDSYDNIFAYFKTKLFTIQQLLRVNNFKVSRFHSFIDFNHYDVCQGILDSFYFRYIIDNKIDSIFLKNIKKTVKFEINYFENLLNRSVFLNSKDELFIVYESLYLKLFDKKFLKNAVKDCVTRLYLNFLYELLLCIDDKSNISENFIIKNKNQLCDYIECLLKTFSLIPYIKQYYVNGFFEICEFEQIVVSNNYFSSQKNRNYLQLDFYNINSKSILKFLSNLQDKDSYILKYLKITPENLSSGERSLLNFFSNIYLVSSLTQSDLPNFSFFDDFNNKKYVCDNVILLIDEIDLYCHPAWQQKLLKTFIEETKSFFTGKKVQIIFTTHSPIVLSDLPRSNIIFLERKKDKCCIYEGNLSKETFGANIYKLFDDAFFLEKKGQIGGFAREKIQGIIDKIKPEIRDGETIYPELSFDEIGNLEQQISLIGEPIIRDKLFDMLYKNNPELAIKKKIQRYEAELKKLRNLKNGENL